MYKWLAATLCVMVSVCLGGLVLAGVTPDHIPLECDLSPEQRVITEDDPVALFHGQWCGGVGDTYQVYIDYGDETYESYSTTSNTGEFYHHYETAGKSDGYTWTLTLKVTNGNTSYDYSTVVLDK